MPADRVDLAGIAEAAADAITRDDVESFLALVHPDVEFTSMIAEADGETFHGHAGVRRWWESVRGVFDQASWNYIDVRWVGDRGVAKLEIEGTLSGVDVRQTMWQVGELRDGKLAWWAFFRSEDEAVEAALRPAAT